MTSRRRVRAAAALGAGAVLAGVLGLPGAVAGAPATVSTGVTAKPVSPAQAWKLTMQLAKQAPPLPAGVQALLDAENPAPPKVSAETLAQANRMIAQYNAGTLQPRAGGGDGDGDGGHDGGHAAMKMKNGRGCDAQGFKPDGSPTVKESDLNKDGHIDSWEADPNKNETCLTLGTLPYDTANPDKGSFALERRTETDPASKKTYTRTGLRWNYDVSGAHHMSSCAASDKEGAAGLKLIKDTRAALQKYVNNPAQMRRDGYWPYPVENAKSVHWFNSGLLDSSLSPNDPKYGYYGNSTVLDPKQIEMFTMVMTDEGYVPYNVAYVLQYAGKGDPFKYDANKDKLGNNNKGIGCLVYWHGHTGEADGTATGNADGRTWMSHLYFYGGLDPFDASGKEIDGTEPHGWFTPFQNVPVLLNSEGGGF